jgi:hypothetical protein
MAHILVYAGQEERGEGAFLRNNYIVGFRKIGGGIIRLDQLYFKYLNDRFKLITTAPTNGIRLWLH